MGQPLPETAVNNRDKRMRYEDDDRYLSNEEDDDLWDDELEIIPDDTPSEQPYASNDFYTSDNSDDAYSSSGGQYEETQDMASDKGVDDGQEDYYSEPEPESLEKPRRERFFGKKIDSDDDENDYFDSDDEPVAIKKPKAPKLDPEDPDYWIDEEESPISSIIYQPGNKWKWWLGSVISLLLLLLFVWIWFLRPYADNAVTYGYIQNMERRGSIIKTFEGSMIPYKKLGDPDPLYFKEVRFSVDSDSLAAVMKRMMLGCVPVRVEYEVYHAPLPWKGEEKMIIIKADTADPKMILPPEYR